MEPDPDTALPQSVLSAPDQGHKGWPKRPDGKGHWHRAPLPPSAPQCRGAVPLWLLHSHPWHTAGWKQLWLPGMLVAPPPSLWLVTMQGTSFARRKIKFLIPGRLLGVGSHSSADTGPAAGGATGWLSCQPAVPIFQCLGRAGYFLAAWHGCKF